MGKILDAFADGRLCMEEDVEKRDREQQGLSEKACRLQEELEERLNDEDINICSVRGGNIFGEHEVIFANSKDEVVTFRHSVSSREPFVDGAIEVMIWMASQANGLYGMDDFVPSKVN